MSWTNDDLIAIEQAIASGAREVQYADKKVIYTSMKDLRAARDLITAELTGRRKCSRRYGVYFKD